MLCAFLLGIHQEKIKSLRTSSNSWVRMLWNTPPPQIYKPLWKIQHLFQGNGAIITETKLFPEICFEEQWWPEKKVRMRWRWGMMGNTKAGKVSGRGGSAPLFPQGTDTGVDLTRKFWVRLCGDLLLCVQSTNRPRVWEVQRNVCFHNNCWNKWRNPTGDFWSSP